jgi:hypothetical protein
MSNLTIDNSTYISTKPHLLDFLRNGTDKALKSASSSVIDLLARSHVLSL